MQRGCATNVRPLSHPAQAINIGLTNFAKNLTILRTPPNWPVLSAVRDSVH
jgi:hypothetical protein